MKKVLLAVFLGLVIATPAAAGLWVGGGGSYQWNDDLDWNKHNWLPEAAIGLDLGTLELTLSHPLDFEDSVDKWLYKGKYRLDAVVKFKF